MFKSKFIFMSALILSAVVKSVLVTPSATAWTDTNVAISIFGGTDADYVKSITLDSSGNVYTTGYFSGTADFDPGAGITSLTSAGDSDAFISKLDSSGNFLWAKRFGGTGKEIAYSSDVDLSGNIYTAGFFSGTVDFDPGAGVTSLTSLGFYDAFISKIDSSGNFLWAKSFGGTSVDEIYSIAVDGNGDVYGTGYFRNTVDFDPGESAFNVTASGAHPDIVIWKLDSLGNFAWVKTIGGGVPDLSFSIAVDGFGNIYTTGEFNQTVDFDPGAGVTNLTSSGGSDSFISKFDSSGSFVWAKRFGGSMGDSGASIAVDSSGNIYTAGYFSDTVDFDPGAGVTTLTSAGWVDSYISKFDSSGSFVWAKRFGAELFDAPTGIAVDNVGNAYTTGYFYNTVDFDPGAGVANLTSNGGPDIYISKLGSSGEFIWAKKVGGALTENAGAVAMDNSGNAYLAGAFASSVDFDPGIGVENFTSAGLVDSFVLKFSSSGDVPAVTIPTAPTLTSSTSGDRQLTISFTAGADGGAAITDYKYSLNGGSFISAGTTSSPITITSLSTSTSYSVRLLALNSVGDGAVSSSISATTARSAAEADAAAVAAAKAAAEAAAAKREAEKRDARAEIVSKAINKHALNFGLFDMADISGVNATNNAAVQADIFALKDSERSSIEQIVKVARKFEVVTLISSDRVRTLSPTLFVEIGLIPQASKIKTSLVVAVRNLPELSRDSYAEIKAAIDAKTAELQARKDRLAATLARIRSR